MNLTFNMDPQDPGDAARRAKRKRGPYKQYLDVSKGLEVPRSTIFSRKKAMGSYSLFMVVFPCQGEEILILFLWFDL